MVLVAAVVAFANALPADLLFDSSMVVGNDWRLENASWENVRAIFTQDYWAGAKTKDGLFRPLTTLSYWFQKAVLRQGNDAGAFIALNIGLHALNAGLLLALLHRLEIRAATALSSAVLFAVHPLTTEAVTNVVGRADLLATTTVLGLLLVHRRAAAAGDRLRRRFLLAECAIFGTGLLAKESAIVGATLIVLDDAIRRDCAGVPPSDTRTAGALGPWLKALQLNSGRLIAFALIFASVWAWRIGMVEHRDLGPVSPLDNPIASASWTQAQLTSVKTMLLGLWLMVWPASLSAEYGYNAISLVALPPASWTDWATILGCTGLGACVVAAVRVRSRHPTAAFLCLAWLVALAPVSNFFLRIGTIFGERLLYLPLAFVAPLLVVFADRAARRLLHSRPRLEVATQYAAWAAVCGVAAAFIVRTQLRNRDWYDSVTLFRSAVHAQPDAARAHVAYARALLQCTAPAHRTLVMLDEIIAEAERSRDILSAIPPERRSWGPTLALADFLRARSAFKQEHAEDGDPDLMRAHALLEEAFELERAARIGFGKPLDDSLWGDAALRESMGRCLTQMRRPQDALPFLEAAAARKPREVSVYAALARAYLDLRLWEEAAVAALQGVVTNAYDKEVFAHARAAFVALHAPDVFGGRPGEPQIAGGSPLVRRLLDDACSRLYRLYLPHADDGRFLRAFRERAVQELGCPASLLDAATLAAPQRERPTADG